MSNSKLLEPEVFQEKVLKGIESQQTKTEEVLKNVDRLDKESKAAIADLQKNVNDQAQFAIKLQKAQEAIQQNVRSSWQTPAQRISANDGLRNRFNLFVREILSGNDGLFKPQVDILRKALGQDSSPGSTLVTTELQNEIYYSLASYGAWSTLGVRNVGKKLNSFPIKTVRAPASFITTESAAITADSTKAGTAVTLTVLPIASLIAVAIELLEDSDFDVTADVLEDFSEAFAERLDVAVFQGDGTSNATYGGITGVFPGSTQVTASSGKVTVAGLTSDDVLSLTLNVDAGVLGRPCKWWAHPFQLTRMAGIKDSNGRPIFQTALEAPTGNLLNLAGYGVVPTLGAPSTQAASARIIAFGDPQAFAVGVRKNFTFEASDHYNWNTLQRSFRGHGRAGGVMRKASAMACLKLAAS